MALVVALVSMYMGPMTAMAVVLPTETEPNDTYSTANELPSDGTIMLASYGTTTDNDWYRVSVTAGHSYEFETGPHSVDLGASLDTYLHLYAGDGATLLAFNDDGGPSGYSRMSYTASADGVVYVLAHSYHYLYTGDYGIRVRDVSAPAGDSSIGGTVTDTDLVPLQGIKVIDWSVDPWFQTLASGYMTVAGLALTGSDGTYTMTATTGDHIVEFVDATGDHGGQSYNGGTPFSIDAGTPKTDADAALTIVPKLSAKVAWTARASVDGSGGQGQDDQNPATTRGSKEGYISPTGRFVVFYTGNGLVPEDTNGTADSVGQDWYLKDVQTGEVSLVSVGAGTQSDSSRPYDTEGAAVSADGRYVAFADFSTTLVGNDTNGKADVFYRDMLLGRTTRISVDADGNEGSYGSRSPVMSDDGRYVAFRTGSNLVAEDTNNYPDIYVRDMVDGTIERVSVATDGTEGDSYCDDPSISADGRYVAFQSDSSNLIADDTNGWSDVFMHDMQTGETTRVSLTNDGLEALNGGANAPSLSADGRYVAFESSAGDLVADDTNGNYDVFVRDTVAGTTTCASLTSAGSICAGGSAPDISADGRFVAFTADAHSSDPADPLNILPGDTNGYEDVFVRDMVAGTTYFASVAGNGHQTDSGNWAPRISADGQTVVYTSDATNLVPDDWNSATDVFVTSSLFDITASAGDHGSITPSGSQGVPFGTDLSFAVAADMGFHIADVLVDGVSVGGAGLANFGYDFTNVVQNHTIEASFALDTFTISASAGSNGSISPSGDSTVDWGDTPSYTITPNTGYHVADVLVDSSSVGAVETYDFAAVTGNHTISATFAIDTFTVTSSAGGNGSVSPLGVQTVPYGGSQTFTITPNLGYHVLDVFVDGESVGPLTSVTLTTVTGDHTVAVAFAMDASSADQKVAVYRLYNARSGAHFYTASMAEVTATLWTYRSLFRLEGVAYVVNVANPDNSSPLYRYYNLRTGAHFYTASDAEKAIVDTSMKATFRYEGIGYDVCATPVTDATPVYRFFNLLTGAHFYTASEAERTVVLNTMKSIYRPEGIGFYLAP